MCALQGSRHAQILQEEALRQVDLRRRMRATVVPTGDADVRRLLRQLGEPVTLFGEQQVRAPVPCLQHFPWASNHHTACRLCLQAGTLGWVTPTWTRMRRRTGWVGAPVFICKRLQRFGNKPRSIQPGTSPIWRSRA